MTNFGVLDAVIRPSYPIPSPSLSPPLELQVTTLYFHSVMFYRQHTLLLPILHTWTWQGVLTYAWSYSPAHIGAVDERQLDRQFAGGVGGAATHAVGNARAAAGGSARNGEAGAAEEEGDEKVLGSFILELERIMVMIAEGGAPSLRTRL